MALSGFKHGLFSRLLTVCVSAARVCTAVVTIMFHAYREAITKNRLHAELSSQAMALAPIVARQLAINDLQSTPFVLRAFSVLNYVTGVDLMRDGLRLASWPMPGCDDLKVRASTSLLMWRLAMAPA